MCVAGDHKRGRQEALGGDVDVKGNFSSVNAGELSPYLELPPHSETEQESEDEGDQGLYDRQAAHKIAPAATMLKQKSSG